MPVKLTNHFPRIRAEMNQNVSAAVKVGAELIASDARSRVPVRTGALKNAIHTTFQGDADWNVVAGNTTVFYGHLVERGTTRAAPRPFLIPAFESRKRMVERAVAAALAKAK